MKWIVLSLMLALFACRSSHGLDPRVPEAFPHSMKGYVLYGWERGGEQWFTLVTGTNRQKSFEELDEAEPLVGEDGFVRVRVRGVEEARELLRRVELDEVTVLAVESVTVAANTIPEDVRPLDPAVLESLGG